MTWPSYLWNIRSISGEGTDRSTKMHGWCSTKRVWPAVIQGTMGMAEMISLKGNTNCPSPLIYSGSPNLQQFVDLIRDLRWLQMISSKSRLKVDLMRCLVFFFMFYISLYSSTSKPNIKRPWLPWPTRRSRSATNHFSPPMAAAICWLAILSLALESSWRWDRFTWAHFSILISNWSWGNVSALHPN